MHRLPRRVTRPLPYFPVPANPVDFIETSGSVLTLTSTNTQTDFPYVGGNQVFPYTFVGSGQLTINQNSPQPITDSSQSGIPNATASILVATTSMCSTTIRFI